MRPSRIAKRKRWKYETIGAFVPVNRLVFADCSLRRHIRGEGAVLVPAAALRSDTSGAFVWVVTGGVLRRQPLEARGRVGDRVIVVSGLAGGEQLVVGPADGLREGQAVAVSE